MLVALLVSILFSLAIGILAGRNKRAESVIIPLLDVFQSIPILGFFPIVIFGIVLIFPGVIGVNLAVIFLIFTSMSWNIAFGVYEAVKSIPQDYIDLSKMSNSSSIQRIVSLYIPASLSRIAYNTQTSWAVGLFYLISSEILTLGGKTEAVGHGIGPDIINFWSHQDYVGYSLSILLLLVLVVIWQVVFLREFTLWSERYKFVEEPRETHRDPLMRFYSWVNEKSISKLFLLRQGRGVTRFSSAISRFRRGIKYAALISLIIFIAFEASAAMSFATTGFENLPSLSRVVGVESSVLVALAFSLARIWYVYAICVGVALPLGISIALKKRLYDSIVPVIEVIASVPAPALLPAIGLLARGQGEAVAAIIIFVGMIWYILFNVMVGVRTLPAELWELRRAFHISRLQAWRNIYIPATLSAFITGSITAIGAGWNTLIVAEYFSTTSPSGQSILFTQVGEGIGKTIAIATNHGDLLTLTLAVVSMTTLVVAFNLTVWRRVYHFTTRRYAYNR